MIEYLLIFLAWLLYGFLIGVWTSIVARRLLARNHPKYFRADDKLDKFWWLICAICGSLSFVATFAVFWEDL